MIRNKASILPMVLTAAFMSGASGAYAAGDDDAALKEQITQLQNRVIELEKKLGQKHCPRSQMAVADEDDAMDPFAQLDAMDRRMQMMMAQPFLRPGFMNNIGKMPALAFTPEYDIKSTDKAYVISFDMPGMDKDKINVEVKDGALVVSGERSSETKEEQGGKVYRQQRSFGYFSRVIPLPEDAKPESVDAKYENGVLTLTVERKPDQQPVQAKKKIAIK